MKTALKTMVAVLAIVGGASAAQAATIPLGTLAGTESVGFQNTSPVAKSTSHEFDYSFTIAAGSILEEIDAISNKYASSLSYKLYLGSTLLDTVTGIAVGKDLVADANFDLGAGTYTLKVFEAANNKGAASFGGTVSAVPLPGAVLLFGSGLAGVGLLGRRRKAASAA